jgi:prevent-host-death family protein
MAEQHMQASTFKARCLAVLDEVAATHTSVVITKHGKAVARLVPIDDDVRTTMGSITLLAADDRAYFSTDEAWDAET